MVGERSGIRVVPCPLSFQDRYIHRQDVGKSLISLLANAHLAE